MFLGPPRWIRTRLGRGLAHLPKEGHRSEHGFGECGSASILQAVNLSGEFRRRESLWVVLLSVIRQQAYKDTSGDGALPGARMGPCRNDRIQRDPGHRIGSPETVVSNGFSALIPYPKNGATA